jgi:hypothetical protein
MPWVTAPADRALLRARYEAYVGAVRSAVAATMPSGAMLMLHTYAPRDVDVQVDEHIVTSLRRAYQPEVEPTWPLRPEIDLIGRDLGGVSHLPSAVADSLRSGMAAAGVTVGDGRDLPAAPEHPRVGSRHRVAGPHPLHGGATRPAGRPLRSVYRDAYWRGEGGAPRGAAGRGAAALVVSPAISG